MTDTMKKDNTQIRAMVSLVACIIIGIIFIASGSGKIIGFGEVPGRTMEFIGFILPDALLKPFIIYFIYEILIPYILPWFELVLGCLLLVGFVPRLIAVLCLPLSLMLMGNNIWAIAQGMAKYTSCECFGIWETMFGELTPVQSLGIDILILVLALVIVFVHPGKFLSSRKWLTDLGKKKEKSTTDGNKT
jgi:uncharacterized membrane protein YphA (DoxX/SURF4 family)